MRKLHRISGLVALIFLFSLSITGILLNHPKLLDGLSSTKADIPAQILSYANSGDRHYIGTKKGLYVKDNGIYKKVPLRHPSFPVTSILSSGDHLFVGMKNHLLLTSSDQGDTWSRVDLPEKLESILSMSLSETGLLSVVSDDGVYVKNGDHWTHTIVSSPGAKWTYLVRKIHSGYIFAPLLIWVHDIAAVLFIFLGLSGLLIYLKTRK